jgi:hypothetical protein
MIYMGKDKFENEDLIKYGWPEDVWFHVDDMSSAHVYLRMPEGQTWDDISTTALEECCQLVKANSIKGSKAKSVKIVLTPWANLKKTKGMEDGQVGFHSLTRKRYRTVEKDRDILRALAKTKTWVEEAHLERLRGERDAREREQLKAAKQAEATASLHQRRAFKKEAELRSYKTLFEKPPAESDDFGAFGAEGGDDGLTSTPSADHSAAQDWEEDFM